MNFLPIIDELFSSDSIIYMIIGLIIAIVISCFKIRDKRKCLIGMLTGFIVYAVCEAALNIHINNALDLALLFIGTVAIGLFIGFLIGMAVAKIRIRK